MTDRCPRCMFPVQVCLCGDMPVVDTRTRIVIVRHRLERFRSSNTGRLAHLALPNSELVDLHFASLRDAARSGEAGPCGDMPSLAGAWLLFPEGEVAHAAPEPPPSALVVLDATWSQARRMYRKLDALRGLPMLRLRPVAPPIARLREAPTPDRVSTIEAIAAALRLLEGDAVATPLEQLYTRAVAAAGVLGRRAIASPTSGGARSNAKRYGGR